MAPSEASLALSPGVWEGKEWFCFKSVLRVGEFSQDCGSVPLLWDPKMGLPDKSKFCQLMLRPSLLGKSWKAVNYHQDSLPSIAWNLA